MANHLSDEQVVALIERMEAGRTGAPGAYAFDPDARDAATELTAWMSPFAHELLGRLAPALRGTLTVAETTSYVWMFLSGVSLAGYLRHRSERSADTTERVFTPRQYLFNRRSQLKAFFRQSAIRDAEFGGQAKRVWQDAQSTQRQLNRFCHKGRLLEYHIVATEGGVQTWTAMLPWCNANTARPYHERRFLPRGMADGLLTLQIGPSELEHEARLVQSRHVEPASAIVPASQRRLTEDPTAWTLTSFKQEQRAGAGKPRTLWEWLDHLFRNLNPTIALRGSTILTLRRAQIESIPVDNFFADTYGGQL